MDATGTELILSLAETHLAGRLHPKQQAADEYIFFAADTVLRRDVLQHFQALPLSLGNSTWIKKKAHSSNWLQRGKGMPSGEENENWHQRALELLRRGYPTGKDKHIFKKRIQNKVSVYETF